MISYSSTEIAPPKLERFAYDNKVVKAFSIATIIWGLIGMLVGVIAATQLFQPAMNMDNQYTTFGRIRPLHTNAVIFAFVGNAIFMGVYYSLQRLLKARMFSDVLSWIHFWGWQLIIVSAVATLPLGITSSKEYAELEWPIDIAITLIWVVFGINMFGTIIKRRERHLYVGIWVLHRHVYYRSRSARGEFLLHSRYLPEELFYVRWRSGCSGAMVVRAQRGGVLPDHALSGADVLLPAQNGQPARLQL
ncbi:cbb3-type cytochrome oxidase subunit 1 [Siphonobacter sp. SORGH_AS 1065]|nr:cbb3-type cytochrome oxidase subunit 1 [Siphonobacter sp. SORGH_AS_1065]